MNNELNDEIARITGYMFNAYEENEMWENTKYVIGYISENNLKISETTQLKTIIKRAFAQ